MASLDEVCGGGEGGDRDRDRDRDRGSGPGHEIACEMRHGESSKSSRYSYLPNPLKPILGALCFFLLL